MRTVSLVILVAAIGLSGCGSSNKDSGGGNGGATAAKAAVVKYFGDLTSNDYAATCAAISKKAVAKIETGGHKCADVVKAGLQTTGTKPFQGASVGDAKVTGDTGTIVVTLKTGQKLTENLVYEDGRWKIERPGT